MQMGASLHWVSAFPSESEVLYPPLTYLHPTGRRQWLQVTVDKRTYTFHCVEFEPHLP